MAGSMPDWKGLFEWSIKNQDTETPADPAQRRQVTEQDRKWFEEAMQHYTVDFTSRMKDINASLDQPADDDAAAEQKGALMDELLDIVDDIDHARDLQKIGGLPVLLSLLRSQHASLRSKAAELVATCVQNNPPVQQEMQADMLPQVMRLLGDSDASVRAKALLALSSLLRGNSAGLDQFREQDGLHLLERATQDPDARVRRKGLQLLRHLVQQRPQDAADAFRGTHLAGLVNSDDPDTREAAMGLLTELAASPAVAGDVKKDSALQQQIGDAAQRLSQLRGDDADAVLDETAMHKQLAAQLANAGSNNNRRASQNTPTTVPEAAKPPLLLGPA